jgi:hypothetical protein
MIITHAPLRQHRVIIWVRRFSPSQNLCISFPLKHYMQQKEFHNTRTEKVWSWPMPSVVLALKASFYQKPNFWQLLIAGELLGTEKYYLCTRGKVSVNRKRFFGNSFFCLGRNPSFRRNVENWSDNRRV